MFSERSNSNPAICLKHLSKKYAIYERPLYKFLELISLNSRQFHTELWSLKDIDLEVPSGTTLGIIGQNGSGKSTLLQVVAGILKPNRGKCFVEGTVAALLELGTGFNPEFTGRENVFMNGAIMGMGRAQIEERMDSILQFAEIGNFIDQPVKTYSSGMFIRLAFSVAIHVEPDILLVDEALAVGDLVFQHRCTNRIRRLRQEGKTILFVTHDLQAVTRFCNSAILLDQGKKVCEGDPAEVVQFYQALIAKREGSAGGLQEVWIDKEQDRSLKVVRSVPQIHHRYGEGGAKIIGIIVHSIEGKVQNQIRAMETIQLSISARIQSDLAHPIIGFTIRDHLGVEITASNSSYAGLHLPPVKAGDTLTVGFEIQVPPMRPGSYSISPAISDGNIWEHRIEDWIDNAYIVDLEDSGLVYGMMRWRTQVCFKIDRD